MSTVLEFTEVAQPVIEIDMPTSAQIIYVDAGSGLRGRLPTVSIFAVCDPTGVMAKRRFAVVFTGQDIPAGGRHVGTFIAGPYVHHVFELA